MTNEMSPADFAAMNGGGMGFGGGNGAWWIIILFIFAIFGWGGNGGYGNGGGSVKDAYVLSSDFATIQRQLSDGFNGIDNALDRQNTGICDLGYTQAQLINGVNTTVMQGTNTLGSQIADCCCKTQSGIERINTNMALNTNAITRDIETGFCQTNNNMTNQHYQTMQAIDKVGDRVIDWLSHQENQRLRDENFTFKLSASQAAQNNYLVNQLRPCPVPAYITCNPFAASYGVNQNPCGYNGTWG